MRRCAISINQYKIDIYINKIFQHPDGQRRHGHWAGLAQYTGRVPAEGIHLSALDDLIAWGPAPITSQLAAGARREAARLGSVLVDLPYFERFAQAVVNYLIGRPQQTSRWGDTFHHRQPIAIGTWLMQSGCQLAQRAHSPIERERGELIIAFALGYIAHAAVDRSLHPLVNAMARARSQHSGRTVDQEHHEVEKYQSILFHEERFGIDMMGRRFLFNYLDIDFSLLCGRRGASQGGPLWPTLCDALMHTHGESPTLRDFRRWTRSFDDYCLILTSPLGATVVPDHEKLWVRPWVFDAVCFPLRYRHAIQQAQRWADALLAWGRDGVFDTSAERALAAIIPEGSIDPSPESSTTSAAGDT